jgi:hypothetical protein
MKMWKILGHGNRVATWWGRAPAWTGENGALVEAQPGISELSGTKPLHCAKTCGFHREQPLIPKQLICYQCLEAFDSDSLPPFLGISMKCLHEAQAE